MGGNSVQMFKRCQQKNEEGEGVRTFVMGRGSDGMWEIER